jgi:uncharacterized protein (UPF0332 family)
MTLKQWTENAWLRPHKTSKKEVSSLLKIVERDLHDAEGEALSADWRFGIAYNAALKLCTILLGAEGFRAERGRQHHYTIQAMPLILGESCREDARYLDTCRNKRNIVEYDSVGEVTDQDVGELIEFVKELKESVLRWLKEKHPELL